MPGFSPRNLRWALAAVSLIGALGGAQAFAQFGPPSTIFGSVTDSAGEVPAGLPVEAYVGDKLCSNQGRTEFTGDGASKVTVYFARVVSKEQAPGCGAEGVEVRLKIGDRFAPQTAKWHAPFVQVDVTFGSATPAPIPTFTPTTPGPAGTPAPGGTPAPAGTIPRGSPGAGSPVPTLRGGVTNATPRAGGGSSSGGDGFPLWAVVLIVLAGIAVTGGAIGYGMSRNRGREDDEDEFGRPPQPPE